MCIINLIILISGFSYPCYCVIFLPVFMLDNEKVLNSKHFNNDPLAITTTNEFSQIIKDSVKSSEVTILFIEENFCREDTSLKDHLGTPYYHLREGISKNTVKYLPSVETPYKTLTKTFHPQAYNVFHISSSDYKPQIHIQGMKHFYFYFKDETYNNSRSEVLRNHDFIIKEIYSMISEQTKKPIIAFYTGKNNPILLEREKYLAKPPNYRPLDGVFVRAPRAMFYFKGISNIKRNMRTDISYVPMMIREDIDKNSLRTVMNYSDFELGFNFILDPWYWTLDNVVLLKNNATVGRTYIDATVRWGRSYACSNPIVITNRETNDILRISNYQLQPLQDDDDEVDDIPPPTLEDIPPQPLEDLATPSPIYSFAQAEKCSGYVTAGILTCLLLSFFCLILIIIAAQFLMNIHANDRFDDSRFQGLFNVVKE